MSSMKDAKVLKKELLVDSFKKVVQETLAFTETDIQPWIYLDSPKSIMVVALTPQQEIVLVSLYRHNLKRQVCELPAGGAEHENETAEAAARRELLEETGYHSEKLIDLGAYYVLPSETNRWVHYFLALDAVKTGEPKLDTLIEKYFDMSVLQLPFATVTSVAGTSASGICGVESLFGVRAAAEYLQKHQS